MERKKKILIISICLLIISVIVLGVFYLINTDDYTTLVNGGETMELTEDPDQILRESILSEFVDEMSDIERKNALLFLNAMREKGFVENTYPGRSGVGRATRILTVLGVGEIIEFTIVRLHEGVHDLSDVLIIRIVNEENKTYYIWYSRTWGLQMVIEESEYGEMIFSSATHIILNGQIYRRSN